MSYSCNNVVCCSISWFFLILLPHISLDDFFVHSNRIDKYPLAKKRLAAAFLSMEEPL